MAYSDKVMDHYDNPRNVGKMDDADDSVGTGMVGAPACGDVMRLQIKVNADGTYDIPEVNLYAVVPQKQDLKFMFREIEILTELQ